MSSALSYRLANRRVEATQKLIVFYIQQEWFALPIQAAERVLEVEQVYGAPTGNGLQFTHYRDREILVIDAAQRIFGNQNAEAEQFSSGDTLPRLQASSHTAAQPLPRPSFLLILQNGTQNVTQERVGIPLYTPPSLQQVPLSAFKPLPSAYLAEGAIQCVSALVVVADQPPMFLLNPDLLLQTLSRSLPPRF
ncbi:chemotaxis protein CheW [Phormidium tenue FACHB-886]|nr:chemotaxis protein CheW [Phormidium tenue FACHB-886]